MEPPALTDGVVRLRAWEPADAEWYAAVAAQDELIQRFTSESATVTADQVRRVIEELPGQPAVASFVICDSVTSERLGNIGLTHEHRIGHVSYWLAAAARGRGAATRALRLFSYWAVVALGLAELRLWMHVDNAGSRRVAERAGYHRDPRHDQRRQVKGASWETAAYRLSRTDISFDQSATDGSTPVAEMHHFAIATVAEQSADFRRVRWTGRYAQLVTMTIPPGGEIGEEVHPDTDQLLTFVSGTGEAEVAGQTRPVSAGDLVVVPAGTPPNFRNTGPNPLVLYTVYGPPEHPDGAVHATKAEADAAEAAGEDEPPVS